MDTSKVIAILILVSVGLSAFTSSPFVFLPISALGLVLGIIQFIKDRRELKQALFYARVPTPLWREILSSAILIGILVLTTFIPDEYRNILFKGNSSFFIFPLLIASVLDGYYTKFTESIRAFESGIKLPGKKSQLIGWSAIHNLTRTESMTCIESSEITQEYKIDDRDHEDFDAIVGTWQSKGSTAT